MVFKSLSTVKILRYPVMVYNSFYSVKILRYSVMVYPVLASIASQLHALAGQAGSAFIARGGAGYLLRLSPWSSSSSLSSLSPLALVLTLGCVIGDTVADSLPYTTPLLIVA